MKFYDFRPTYHWRCPGVQGTAPAAAPAPAPAAAPAADLAAVDEALGRLSSKKAAWAAASLDERMTILKEIRARLLDQVGAASPAGRSQRHATRGLAHHWHDALGAYRSISTAGCCCAVQAAATASTVLCAQSRLPPFPPTGAALGARNGWHPLHFQ